MPLAMNLAANSPNFMCGSAWTNLKRRAVTSSLSLASMVSACLRLEVSVDCWCRTPSTKKYDHQTLPRLIRLTGLLVLLLFVFDPASDLIQIEDQFAAGPGPEAR